MWELGTAIPGSQLLKHPDQKWSLGAERMKEGWKAKELWRARGRRGAEGEGMGLTYWGSAMN